MLKKKGLIVWTLLSLFCCACNKENAVSVTSWEGSKPDAGVRISAELLSEKTVGVQMPFEVMVGIGNCGVYSTGNLEIEAPGFEITNAEGTAYTDVYTCLYEGFDEATYGYRVEEEEYLGLKYSEHFQMKYIGDAEEGEIAFLIVATQQEEGASEGKQKSGAAMVSLYYSVKEGKIDFTTLPPLDEGANLLYEVE